MSDREKVIKGLECCVISDEEGVCPDDCPYYSECWQDTIKVEKQLKKDALALLKAKQLRAMTPERVKFVSVAMVMTLEELIGIYNLRENHSWVYNTPPYLYMDYYGKDIGYWIAWSNIVSCLERCYPKYIPEDYGKTWRCWSARPTDEEKRKVAWE